MSIETKKLGLIEKSIKAIEEGQTISLSTFQANNKEWLNNKASR